MLTRTKTLALLTIVGLLPSLASAMTKKSKSRRKPASTKSAVHKRTTSKKKTVRARTSSRKSPKVIASVPPAVRASSMFALTSTMSRRPSSAIENEAALVPFFDQLYRSRAQQKPIHIVQFGDSHTASDDWTNAMRRSLQFRFGDGGPGFTYPGHPYRGYRNFRAPSGNSPGWKTEGVISAPGDGREGLGGISLNASHAGENVWLQGEGDQIELFFMLQPGGGQLNFLVDGQLQSAVSTDGPAGPGYFTYSPLPGYHTFEVRTVTSDPVRLFGWVLQNNGGVTYETLGINGAQADLVASWHEGTFAPQLQRRDPALIVFAYGTNEALSPHFTEEGYRASFAEALARLRRASPTASILVVGPPDCWLKRKGRLTAFPHMEKVIEIQREIAARQRCSFWDWRRRMGGEGSKQKWVNAGLAQVDYVHFTSTGYQLIGNTLCADLLDLYNIFVSVRTQAENDRSTENHERAPGSNQE